MDVSGRWRIGRGMQDGRRRRRKDQVLAGLELSSQSGSLQIVADSSARDRTRNRTGMGDWV